MKNIYYINLVAFLVLLLCLSSLNANSQHSGNQIIVGSSQDAETIKQIENERKKEAIEYLDNLGKRSSFLLNGELVEVQYLDINGNPVFYAVDNADASRLTNVDQVKRDGRLGLNLSGKGVNVAVWDGGAVLQSHQELVGRAIGGDAPDGLSDHATHVTGTIIASGVNVRAKGMASSGKLKFFDFNNDNSEMIAAAKQGTIISNHSYGEVLGWYYDDTGWVWAGDKSISETEDYRFGNYTSSSAGWDNIAWTNPYYLIVKSSGNDRSDVGSGVGAPGDGPFDTIGPKGCAKNILTVGAVNKSSKFNSSADIESTSFSSWGPTDDGRIKPDIVGVGQGLFSSSSAGNDQYTTMSGTSMSAPNVTGGLVLLQELYFNIHASYMLSATLKGLVIHTAQAAGDNRGPDYRFGWGVLDVSAASELLMKIDDNNQLVESSIAEDDEFVTYSINATKGDLITATVSWTDIPGSTVNSGTLNPTDLRIVNDLDSRLYFGDSIVGLPYIMDPVHKSQSRGDNFRDNVEKIHFIAKQTGVYELRISHKGLSEGVAQNYSLILSASNDESGLTTMILNPINKDWNDLTNWKNYDGSTVDKLPSKNTVVLLDGEQNGSIKLEESVEVFSISQVGDSAFELDLNGHTLSVNNLNLNNASQIIKDGTLLIDSNFESSLLQLKNKNSFENISIHVNKESGKSVSLIGNLQFSKLSVSSGELKFNGSNVEIDSLILSGTSLLSSLNSTLTINGKLDSNADSLKFESSRIVFRNDGTRVNGNIYNIDGSVEFVGNNIEVKGNILASDIFVSGHFNWDGDITTDDFVIYDSSSISFESSANIFIDSNFSISDTLGSRIGVTLQSLAGKSFIESNKRNKICFSDLNVLNIDTKGSTAFVLEGNSTASNSEGWVLENCDDVLDAIFFYELACANGVTKFYNVSDGKDLTSFLWEFKTEDEVFTSNQENPEVEFSNEGVVEVSFRVTTDADTSLIVLDIKVNPAKISKPSIEFVNGVLSSTRFSDNYQWYVEGVPIEDSNSPSLAVGDLSGDFYVEIFNSNCLMRSDVYQVLITSNLPEIGTQVSLYPNPSKGVFRVDSEIDFNLVGIYDLNGRIVNYRLSDLSDGTKEIRLNDQDGVFLAVFRIQNVNYVKKLVVLK